MSDMMFITVKNPITDENVSVPCNVTVSCSVSGEIRGLTVMANGYLNLDASFNPIVVSEPAADAVEVPVSE